MVVANKKLGVSETGEKQVKRTVDFKAHSQHKLFLKASMQAKRGIVLSDFFPPRIGKFGRGIFEQGAFTLGSWLCGL